MILLRKRNTTLQSYPMVRTTMRFYFILVLLCLVGWGDAEKCPAKYKRFISNHTFCLPPNKACKIHRIGVTEEEKELILRLHNKYRSKVAMGKGHGTLGGDTLPQAADMMQMVWDDELAAIAQKWTQHCDWGHDCGPCRGVENYEVGQNLALQPFEECADDNCLAPNDVKDWRGQMEAFYDEIKDYDANWIVNYKKLEKPMIGHLTQLIWAKSWRVGCGYSFYKIGRTYQQYYACNYGPSGNAENVPVYKQGSPCSACPINTQCSTITRGPNNFPGLCKMRNPYVAPEYPENPKGLFLLCRASKLGPRCPVKVSGDGKWKTVRSVGEDYHSIELKGGQSTTVSITKSFTPHGAFCFLPTFRKGPLDASQEDESILTFIFKVEGYEDLPMIFKTGKTHFASPGLNLKRNAKTQISFTFSVPKGARKHVLDIRKIMVYDGRCSSRKS